MKVLYRTVYFPNVCYYVGNLIRETKRKYEIELTHIANDDGTIKHSIKPVVTMVMKDKVRLI
jgi:hypothetical protein